MSNYPNSLDDDTTLPVVNDNLTEIGGDAINAVRDAVFNLEQALGTNIAGVMPSLAARLGVFINPDGTPNASVITSLGLVTLPITNNQIANNAGIPESKLQLDYRTQDLFNYIRDLSRDINIALGWVSVSGVKLEPHLIGVIYRHDLTQIDVIADSTQFLNNKFRVLRDNSTAFNLINDMNNELLAHQWADGSPFGIIKNVTTNNGSIYPSNYAHVSSGIFLNSSTFGTIPQTVQDVQAFADFIDSASIFLFGTRIQNFYSNGVSRNSRSSQLNLDGYGQSVIPFTPATTYLSKVGSPLDDISTGDDIITFNPSASDGYAFDEKFSLVKVGDIIRVNYGTVVVPFVIKEKKYSSQNGVRICSVRIAGKNLFATTTATARVDKPLFNNNKFGVLATASANDIFTGSLTPSVIIGSPRGAQALGIGFNPDQLDNAHYLLYLALYPTGNPLDGYTILPPIDVTGNAGATPGAYTLDSVVQSTNDAFRKPGYNYRFIAFQYNGAFGIMLADSYRNAGFSIINGVVNSSGIFDPFTTNLSFSNNVVGVFPPNLAGTFTVTNGSPSVATTVSQVNIVIPGDIIVFSPQSGSNYVVSTVSSSTIVLTTNYTGTNSSSATATLPNDSTIPDPLGFGFGGANIASPPFLTSYSSAQAAQNPTHLFVPLKRNTYYVNGTEREKLTLDVGQAVDNFGDGYWIATVDGYNAIPGSRVEVTYKIPLDLSTSLLKAGKTLVVQTLGSGSSFTDAGRFIIKNVTFECAPNVDTKITVWDAVHATGVSPFSVAPIGTQVAIYFNSDSVTFNAENSSDISGITPFKRYFEIYIDQNGNTFSGERGRIFLGSNPGTINGVNFFTDPNLSHINFVEISPKLRGYQFGSVNKITLMIQAYDGPTGQYVGQLVRYDGTTVSNMGPVTYGRRGQITTFYDETNTDYIKLTFDLNINEVIGSVSPAAPGAPLDIQLFPTLALDEEIMLLSSCQLNDTGNVLSHFVDRRQFGNVSEEQLSTSALDFIATPQRLLNGNGVIRGFDLEQNTPAFVNPVNGQIFLTGGTALVNGKFIQMNPQTVTIPLVQESFSSSLFNINWLLCVNSKGEYQPIVLTNFDSIFNTPNSGGRTVTLFNVLNGSTYLADSSTFSTIINSRKDLLPLYVVASTVTTPSNTISLNVSDARKYVTDIDTNLPLQLATFGKEEGNSQGNFKNPTAIFNWLKFNNQFNGTATVRGAGLDTTGGVITTPLVLDFINAVTIDGENNANLIMNAPVGIGSNLTLKNMFITFNGSTTGTTPAIYAVANSTNLTIDNCNITINISASQPSTNNIVFNFLNSVNTKILNSTIIVNYNPLITAPSNLADITAYADIFRLNQSSNFLMDNTQIQANFLLNPGVNVPGNILTTLLSSQVTIKNSGFSGNFHRGIANNKTSSLHITNTSISSHYSPYPSSAHVPDFGFNFSSFVNTGQGYIYALVDTTLDDFIIDDCFFSYTPNPGGTDGYQANRFSFINIELSTGSSILRNLKVTNNRFAGSSAPSVDDIRPCVAIINICAPNTSPTANSQQQPLLINANISNNYCTTNQAIIVTSKTYNALNDGFFNMFYPGLAAVDCIINGNVCGHVGYWISSGSKTISIPPNVGTLSDKSTGLTISSNICHDITNVDHNGIYFLVSAVQSGGAAVHDYAFYPSGDVVIRDNKCNWIHTGIAFEENSSLKIINNSLSAYDPLYLSNILDFSLFGVGGYGGVSPSYAIFVSSLFHKFTSTGTPTNSNDSAVEIAGNSTSTGYWIQTGSSSLTTYKYAIGYIFSQPSAQIHHNVLKGIANPGGAGLNLILVSGVNNIITNNKIYRQGTTINAYVAFPTSTLDGSAPVWGGDPGGLGANTKGLVADNFFDSPFIDAANTNTATFSLPTAATTLWRVERNINQTVVAKIPPTIGIMSINDGSSDQVVAGKIGGLTNSFLAISTDVNPKLQFVYNDSGISQGANWHIPFSMIIPVNCAIISAAISVVSSANPSSTATARLSLNDSLGNSTFPNVAVTFSTSPQTITNSNTGYSSDQTRGGYALFSILISSTTGLPLTVSASNMVITYRWL